MMRAVVLASALMLAGPALAEQFTGQITDWNPERRNLTLDNGTAPPVGVATFQIPPNVAVPEFKIGDRVTVNFSWNDQMQRVVSAVAAAHVGPPNVPGDFNPAGAAR